MNACKQALLFVVAIGTNLSLPAQPVKQKKQTTEKSTDKSTAAVQGSSGGSEMTYPYAAAYSSQFIMGNPEHARMILTMWKDWDENRLDRSAALLADTITMEAPNGEVVIGKDNYMKAAKETREQYTAVTSTVDAWMPLRSTDRNENWVAIWCREKCTGADGKITTNRLHEIWRINKDGQIDFMRQFTAKPSAK